ncbi:MAG: hypothetical protein Ta2F_07460 [Termitinemataceae bacterium]|nr:MAG: hypothetical protein Ta2F_07460 [Termitinemataceae bacterium]
MSNLPVLAVLAGLNLNLLLQFGLGINQVYADLKGNIKSSLLNYINLFLTVFIVWVFWTYIISPLSLGFLQYFLLYPLVSLLFSFIEIVLYRLFLFDIRSSGGNSNTATTKKAEFQRGMFLGSSSYHGLCITALIITLFLSAGAVESLALSFFFAFGALVSTVILSAIRQRTSNECVGAKFRGMPLLLISAGLLSLVFSSIAFVLLLQ